jgi:hypothetical protein
LVRAFARALEICAYFGNESSKFILQEYGILPKDNEEMDVLVVNLIDLTKSFELNAN